MFYPGCGPLIFSFMVTKVNKASADWAVQIISSRLSFTKACNKQCFFHDS